MTPKQQKAVQLTRTIQQATVDLAELLASDGAVNADARLEYVKQSIQTHIKPLLDQKLRSFGGHQGGFRITLAQVDGFIQTLLSELDIWEVRGIAPESAERLAQMGSRDKAGAERIKAIEALLHDYHEYVNNPEGSMTDEDDMDDSSDAAERLNGEYEALFKPA